MLLCITQQICFGARQQGSTQHKLWVKVSVHTHRPHAAHTPHATQAGTAQQLQQHGFQLIILVVGTQQHGVAMFSHPVEYCAITHHTGLAFKPKIAGLYIHAQGRERDSPTGTLGFAVQFPFIGFGLNLMIHMHCMHWHLHRMQAVKKHRGIDPA
jgi:hypothetical protein